MALTNYWWLLIWFFIGTTVLSLLPKRTETLGGTSVERWDYLPAIILVIPYIIWAGFRKDNFGDTFAYRRSFLNSSGNWADIPGLFFSDEKDPGYTALEIIMKSIIGNQDELFLLIIAAFQLVSVALIFRKYARDYSTCIFLFIISTDYLSWMHNGNRQFIAITIIFAGFDFLVKKKYTPLILLILLASLFHGSALIMLPIIFIVQGQAWNRKTLLMLVLTLISIVFIDRFTPILNDLLQETQYDDMMTNEIWTNDDGTNIIRVLVYSVPAIVSLFGIKYLRSANNPAINICVNCSIITMALYLVASVSSGIYIGRLPMYTTLQGYIALPWLIDHIFESQSARIIRALMYILFFAFFYYQMAITWNML